ncbi:hypothetical protein K525DRAFT_207460 [Schizophyllum commune Loenen D]|nr:hypothetical protein K525DRAFT_207460 [Schizophyllum commune Loenen D]
MRFFINLLLRQVTMPLLSGSSPPRSCAKTTRAVSRRDSEAQPRQINQSSSRTHDSASKETQQAVPLQAPQQAPSADNQHHLVQLHSALLKTSWEPVVRPSLTTHLPLLVKSPDSFVYFDRITHLVHVPRPVVAVFKVSEKINTIYFTLPDRLDAHAIPTSHVVYACACHNSTFGLDLLILAKDSVRPFTKEAYEVAHLNMRVYRQMVRQHLFMHYARIYSEVILASIRHRADALTLGPDATTTIPGIPYFEHYMFNVAKPLAWNCKDITEIFDPPDMRLCFAA